MEMTMKDVLFWGAELKTSLRDISQAKTGSGNGCFVEFDLKQGTAIAWSLFKDDHVEAFRAYFSNGAVFPLHDHIFSVETLILYRGAMDILVSGKDIKPRRQSLQIGRPFYLERGVNHKLLSHADSWMIATLIPPDGELTS